MPSSLKKAVIYTVICGPYDTLKQPETVHPEFDYVCFTDQEFQDSGTWTIKPFVRTAENRILTNRYHKMHPHILFPEYQYSVYIDGNIQIKGNHLYERILDLIKSDGFFSMPVHPYRECVYQEIQACLDTERDKTLRLWRYVSFLKNTNYPPHNGLNEACIIFREHHRRDIIQIMEAWWELLNTYSRRDQLSLPYVLWKHNVRSEPFFTDNGDNVRNHPGYEHFPHLKQKNKRQPLPLRIAAIFIPVRSWRKKIRNLF